MRRTALDMAYSFAVPKSMNETDKLIVEKATAFLVKYPYHSGNFMIL